MGLNRMFFSKTRFIYCTLTFDVLAVGIHWETFQVVFARILEIDMFVSMGMISDGFDCAVYHRKLWIIRNATRQIFENLISFYSIPV